jgi:alpha-soluble NSF attachment protein
VADLAALAGDYPRAIDRYEAVARASLNSNLTKWSVKDYFFKAGACYLANKVFHCDFLAYYRIRLPRKMPFNGSWNKILPLPQLVSAFFFKYISYPEGRLYKDLTEAIEAADEDQFLDKLQAYDQMSKLDKWKTTIFLRIKEDMDAEPDLT